MTERDTLKQKSHGAKMASKSEYLYPEPAFSGFCACETGGHT